MLWEIQANKLPPLTVLLHCKCKRKSWVSSQNPIFFKRLQTASEFPFPYSQSDIRYSYLWAEAPARGYTPCRVAEKTPSIFLLTLPPLRRTTSASTQNSGSDVLPPSGLFRVWQEHFPEPNGLWVVGIESKALLNPFHSQFCHAALSTSLYIFLPSKILSNKVDK